MSEKQRIYIIAPRKALAGAPEARRLVRAANPASALKHVANEFAVAIASQDDCIQLAAAGVRVEQSGETIEDKPETQTGSAEED